MDLGSLGHHCCSLVPSSAAAFAGLPLGDVFALALASVEGRESYEALKLVAGRRQNVVITRPHVPHMERSIRRPFLLIKLSTKFVSVACARHDKQYMMATALFTTSPL